MGTAVAIDRRVYFGALDLTSLTEQAAFADIEAQEVSFTNFGSGGFKETRTGIISGAMTLTLFQDYASGVLDDSVAVGSSYPLSVVLPATAGTLAEGDIAYVATSSITKYQPRDGATGDAAKAQIVAPYSGRFAYGRLGHALAARTTSSNSTGFAYGGPSASQYMVANIHVTAYSGLTSIAVKVQSDDNSGFTSPTDRLSFTSVTAIGAENKTAVGSSGWASETYHRVVWTVSGTGSCTFAVTLGVS